MGSPRCGVTRVRNKYREWSRRKSSPTNNPCVGGWGWVPSIKDTAHRIFLGRNPTGMRNGGRMSHPTYQFAIVRGRRTTPTVVCGGCATKNVHTEIPLIEAYRIRIPEGTGLAQYDPRPRTPTGGRIGNPQSKMRRFIRTVQDWGCVSCSLRFEIAARPGRDARFQERCKSGRR